MTGESACKQQAQQRRAGRHVRDRRRARARRARRHVRDRRRARARQRRRVGPTTARIWADFAVGGESLLQRARTGARRSARQRAEGALCQGGGASSGKVNSAHFRLWIYFIFSAK
jgi:hypothetical protein